MDILRKLFGWRSSKGEITLGFGHHDVSVRVKWHPCKICITIRTPDEIPVCQGNINKIQLVVVEQGFDLHADIQSNTATINWEMT